MPESLCSTVVELLLQQGHAVGFGLQDFVAASGDIELVDRRFEVAPELLDLAISSCHLCVAFGGRGEERGQSAGVLARVAVQGLLKVPAGLLEVVLSLGVFDDEAPNFCFRRHAGSFEAFAHDGVRLRLTRPRRPVTPNREP